MSAREEARLVLVRHGETVWNREGRIQGYEANSPLSGTGEAQARAVAARLSQEGIDLLFSSDSGRTLQTAEPIARATGLEIIADRGLRERAYGIFEGRTFAEIAAEYPADYERMRTRDPDYKSPGGESAIEFQDRIVETMERIAARAAGKRAAVVTHQGVLGVLYRHANDIPFTQSHQRPRLLNASCNHFRFSAGRWLLDLWCDVSHLPDTAAGG
jgi:probable phosphoglycerate mutase